MKKLLSIFTVFSLILITFVNVSATSSKVEQKFNEYLTVKKMNEEYLKNKSSKKFKAMSNYEISQLENYKKVYQEHIYDMKKKSVDELKRFNYTDEQIEAIVNYDGSEEMTTRAASYVDVYGGFQYYSHGSTGSRADVIMAFNWYGSPAYYFDDIFAVTWTHFRVLEAHSALGWEPTHSKYERYTETDYPIKASGTYSDYMQFPKRKSNTHTLSGGSIKYIFVANTNVIDPVVYAAYGYNTINISPSVSFSSAGTVGASISFGAAMTTADSARVYP